MAASEERQIQITGSFRDRITAVVGKIGVGLDRVSGKLRGFGRALAAPIVKPLQALDAFGKKLGGLKTLIGGFFVFLAARRAFRGLESIAEDLDRIAKSAEQVGATTESLSALRHAADLAGVDFAALTTGLRTFERNLETARSGSREMSDAFKDLGLDIDAISQEKGLDLVALFKQVAVRLEGVESATQRVSILTRIFGESGARLAPLFAQGAEGIDLAVQKAKELGLVFSAEELARATALVDAITELKAAFRGLGDALVIQAAPVITAVFTKIKTLITDNREAIVEAAKVVGQALLRVVDVATDGAIGLVGVLEIIPGAFKPPEGAVKEWEEIQKAIRDYQKVLAQVRLPQQPGEPFSITFFRDPKLIADMERSVASLTERAAKLGEQIPGGIADGLRRRKADLIDSLKNTVAELAAPAQEGGKAAGETFADAFAKAADTTGAIRRQLQEQRQALGALRSVAGLQDPSREVQLQLAQINAELQKLDFQALGNEGVLSMEQVAFAIGQVDLALEKTTRRIEGSFAQGFSDAATRILERWTDLTTFGTEAASTLIDRGLGGLTDALGSWIDGTKKAKEAFRDFARDMLRLLAQLIAKFAVLQLVRGATGLPVTLEEGGVIPFPLKKVRRLPIKEYQFGGVATSPQLAIFGEGGRFPAEAFVPLPDGRRIPVQLRGNGGQGLTIVVQAIDHRDVAHWLVQNRGLLLAIQRDGAERLVQSRHAIRGAVA